MSEQLLRVSNLAAGYGSVKVLHDVSFDIVAGEIIVLLGANGAGKTTTLRAINGTIPSQGSVSYRGQEVGSHSASAIVRKGIATVPQGRGTFGDLTVTENLQVGAFLVSDKSLIRERSDMWFEHFPRLAERRTQKAGTLSGGEQQMLAVARAMMSGPDLLLLDEPSLGLAPLVVQELFVRLKEINRESGISLCLIEQSAELALDIADRGFVLEAGRTVLSGDASQLQDDDGVRMAYLGM